MNKRPTYHLLVSALVFLLSSCDKTIHVYPKETEALILLELNTDRTAPRYYKEVTYDHNGDHEETELETNLSDTYTPDERLSMRLVTELYKLDSPEDRIDKGTLVTRRIVTVDRLMEAPQDTLQFKVPEGFYRALTWADYSLKDNPDDWHFKTEKLDAVQADVDHKPQDNHHKNSAAGSCNFSVDFDPGKSNGPVILSETRATPATDHVVPVHLERAVGRFRLWATDLEDFLNSGNRIEDLRIQIIYKQYISAGYNVDTETPNRFVQMRTMETTPTTVPGDGSLLLAYDYVLASSDKEDRVLVDVFVYDEDKELNHYQNITIPLWRNRETVVKGPFLTRKIGSGDIGIDDDFDDEIVVEIPD